MTIESLTANSVTVDEVAAPSDEHSARQWETHHEFVNRRMTGAQYLTWYFLMPAKKDAGEQEWQLKSRARATRQGHLFRDCKKLEWKSVVSDEIAADETPTAVCPPCRTRAKKDPAILALKAAQATHDAMRTLRDALPDEGCDQLDWPAQQINLTARVAVGVARAKAHWAKVPDKDAMGYNATHAYQSMIGLEEASQALTEHARQHLVPSAGGSLREGRKLVTRVFAAAMLSSHPAGMLNVNGMKAPAAADWTLFGDSEPPYRISQVFREFITLLRAGTAPQEATEALLENFELPEPKSITQFPRVTRFKLDDFGGDWHKWLTAEWTAAARSWLRTYMTGWVTSLESVLADQEDAGSVKVTLPAAEATSWQWSSLTLAMVAFDMKVDTAGAITLTVPAVLAQQIVRGYEYLGLDKAPTLKPCRGTSAQLLGTVMRFWERDDRDGPSLVETMANCRRILA